MGGVSLAGGTGARAPSTACWLVLQTLDNPNKLTLCDGPSVGCGDLLLGRVDESQFLFEKALAEEGDCWQKKNGN